jgi:beta-mannosidase
MRYSSLIKRTFLLLFTGIAISSQAQNITMPISSGWQFHEKDEAAWHPAKVPGEVHTDLMANKLIPDPFYRNNEKKVQWIEKVDWEYKTTFKPSSQILSKKNIELIFDGLDTYADVYLNGKLVLQANNMFRQWKVDVKGKLNKGENSLRIYFHSAQNKVDSFAKADLPYMIPDNPRAYVRKAQFHFGWDWGPKLTGCGIWKQVKLVGYDIAAEEKKYQPPVNVELVQKPDEKGTSFYFSIDGKPVYMKGANYIPSDAFVTRMTKDEYRKVLMMAKDANMNMLRVWGGGIYEDDAFYDLCDELGIYIWQDFMFAGTMVPGDDDFFANVKEEIQYQVRRLRNHKCIVLWCGNNEDDEAFHRWGWQDQFRIHGQDSVKLWSDYVRLFHDSIPKWLKEVDDSRPYITTSPKFGWGDKRSFTEGDSHYWGTWWGGDEFEVFANKTGRFISEYGMEAMPGYPSILKFTQPQDRYLFSDILQDHQKAGNGYKKLEGYLKKYMIDSAKINKLSVEDYVYVTQCVQYYGFKNMILIQRSHQPYNMGTLLWQLNDCWPVASWSITDYYNRSPKAAWYAVKEAYRDDVKPARDSIRPIDLKLSDPHIKWKVEGDYIVVSAAAFAKYVYVDIEGYTGKLSDNYFDLGPGTVKKVKFEKSKLPGAIKIKIKSYYDVRKI